jgi:DNA-directed RNA polymerase subunit beta'
LNDAINYSRRQKDGYHRKVVFETEDGIKIETTIGRVIFNSIFGNSEKTFINEPINQRRLDEILMGYGEEFGFSNVVPLIEKIKEVGFECATQSGVSISWFDFPFIKFSDTPLLDNERLNDYKGQIQTEIMSCLSSDTYNHISILIKSGAGKKNSIFQICGFRGKMASPDGSEVPYPVMSNFRKGLLPLEYFISSHGARKGSVDKAISTTKSGYLMRKIVEGVHSIRIAGHQNVCSADKGILKKSLIDEKGKVILPLRDRIRLRYVAEDVRNKEGEVIVRKGNIVDKNALSKILECGLKAVRIMSPMTCSCDLNNICYKCYGNEFFTKEPAMQGFAAGIIAAQSVSEPCTQLAMRVFHKGGVAEDDITGGFSTLLKIFEASNKDELVAQCEEKYPLSDNYEMLYIYLLDEIQKIFLAEGVAVNDRHIEVILREVIKDGEIRGIRNVAQDREGFLSKISFENIGKVLVDTAVSDTEDNLSGLKEKILIAKRI